MNLLDLIEVTELIYEVRVKSSNKLIGYFTADIDGFFYFSDLPDANGMWSDYTLLELGQKLKELNKPWEEKLNSYFQKHNEQ